MLNSIRKNIYFRKVELLFLKGLKNGLIKPFDEELYEKLSHTYIDGIPVSFNIKYLKPIISPGKCFDRSLYMFFALDNAVLVRGDTKDLKLKYGEDGARHGWIELHDYVYDASIMASMPTSLYYSIFRPTDIRKCTIEEYCDTKYNKDFYDDIKNTSLEDLKPYGKKRLDLYTMIPLVKGIATSSDNKEFQDDLNIYLKMIEYDEKEVQDEMDEAIRVSLSKNKG